MRIQEVCARTGLTKKAVNWYAQQKLIRVRAEENGYRDFTEEDLRRLREIALLRGIGLSAQEIRGVLESGDKPAALQKIRDRLRAELEQMRVRVALLDRLIADYSPESLEAFYGEVEAGPVCERLLRAFPGAFGRILVGHFAPFLRGSVQTPEQAAAYRALVDYLDGLKVKIPLAVRLFDRLYGEALARSAGEADASVQRLAQAEGEALEAAKGAVLDYARLRTKWYVRLNPLIRANLKLRQRLAQAGYYEVFTANLRVLSPAYEAHCARLEALDRTLCREQGIHYDARGDIAIVKPDKKAGRGE